MININIDILFQYIYFTTRFYIPSVPNKKKIKQWFECIPYALPKDQSWFFEWIQQHSIVNYYDRTEDLHRYGYMLYEAYHIRKKLTYLDPHHYTKHYEALLFPGEKTNSHLYFAVGLVIICIYCIYAS